MSYDTQQPTAPQGQHSGGGDGPSGPRAGFWPRFAAAFIDGLVLAIPYIIIAVAVDPAVGYLVYLVGSIVYYTMLEGGPKGQTLGKNSMNIRVYDLKQGGSIGYGRAFIRWIGRIPSGILLLGYLWSIWDKENQTWHDKFAGSVVVPESAYPVD